MIPVFKPELAGPPDRLLQTLESSWWGTGPRVAEFEYEFSKYLGTDPSRCLMLNSCTAALHLALLLWPNCHRVLVPGITFVSSALPVIYAGKQLIFVDVGDDLCIDQDDALRKLQSENDVIAVVHMGGQAADIGKLLGLRRIEDCAHALGTFAYGDHVGIYAPGCFSFQATKVLPIGDGGMLVLNSVQDRKEAEALAWCGISQSTWNRSNGGYQWLYDVQSIGYKYRANDVQAALALDQWAGLGNILERKEAVAKLYDEALAGLEWLRLPKARPGTKPSWQEYIIRTPLRDGLSHHLAEKGVATTVHYYPISQYEPFHRLDEGILCADSLPNCERLWREILTIPSYASMTDQEIEQVIDGVRSFQP